METTQTDQDVAQLVWSVIANSRKPHDFVAYCRHAVDLDAGHDLAMRQAQRYWFVDPAPALFPNRRFVAIRGFRALIAQLNLPR